ncbi:MAG: inositol monophosphatase family protein [Sandaracinus sp.]
MPEEPSPAELRAILEVARGIAREAGALVLEGFRSGTRIRTKSDRTDLVTEYDEKCERLVRDRLAKLLPDHDVIGEEGQGTSDSRKPYVWYVDPIDGTTNFAHGHPFFCLAMGLAARTNDGGEVPIAGVVLAPAMQIEWSAARGCGAFRAAAGGAPVACQVSATDVLDDALLATGFPANRARVSDNNYAAFLALDASTHGARRCGAAAMELCLVADGGYDGFWDIGLKAWDVAAGAVIVSEAGGRVSRFGAAPLALRTFAADGGRVIATNGRIHEALARRVGEHSPVSGLPLEKGMG